jgi:hypothetical protein
VFVLKLKFGFLRFSLSVYLIYILSCPSACVN